MKMCIMQKHQNTLKMFFNILHEKKYPHENLTHKKTIYNYNIYSMT